MILFQLALARLSFRNGCCATCMGWSKTRVLVWKDCQFRGWDIFLEGWLSDSIRNFTITLVKFDQWSNTGYSVTDCWCQNYSHPLKTSMQSIKLGIRPCLQLPWLLFLDVAVEMESFGAIRWYHVVSWFCQRVLFPIFGASQHPLNVLTVWVLDDSQWYHQSGGDLVIGLDGGFPILTLLNLT